MSEDEDFIRAQGPAFVPHLFIRLSDTLVEAAKGWYQECGIAAPPRTSSTLIALDERGPLGVTEIAAMLRQSHQLVLHWIGLLRQLGLVRSARDEADGRRTLVSLTPKGRREVARLRKALRAIDAATAQWIEAAQPGLYDSLWKLEALDRERPFPARIRSAAARGE